MMQTPRQADTARWRFADDADLRRALSARLAATLAGRRPVARLLDDCPAFDALTVVVADLAVAAAAWAALLGGHGEAPDPVALVEPGLAQQFALGPCTLLLFQPAEGTAAADFLRCHGDGLYTAAPAGRAPFAALTGHRAAPFAVASA
jgi:hypothetical protein